MPPEGKDATGVSCFECRLKQCCRNTWVAIKTSLLIPLLHFQNFCITQHLVVKTCKPYQPLGFLSGRDSIYTLSAFEKLVLGAEHDYRQLQTILKRLQKGFCLWEQRRSRAINRGVARGDAQIKNTAFSAKDRRKATINLAPSYFW